ncbi:PAS domain-containing protein [Lachnospiraceae bacterium 29-84]
MPSNLLEQYKILVEFLGKTLGPDYEVVLQDIDPEHSQIVAIANGHISGREIGSPLTDAALKMLANKSYKTENFQSNYRGVAGNGHILRSSTMFIRDENGAPIGLLCINFDDSRYKELHQKLFDVVHPEDFLKANPIFCQDPSCSPLPSVAQQDSITENFTMDIPSLMQKIFDDATTSLTTSADRLNQHEKKEVIQTLHERGLFQLKGAIPFVAKHFSCSSATIYRYLSELANE